MGGLKLSASAALLKLALDTSGAICRIGCCATHDANCRFTTTRHNSQVSQLAQCKAASSLDVCECMMQSAGIGVWLVMLAILDCSIVVAAMSTAMMLPAQPRKGSKISMKAINNKCVKRDMYE